MNYAIYFGIRVQCVNINRFIFVAVMLNLPKDLVKTISMN